MKYVFDYFGLFLIKEKGRYFLFDESL